MPRKSRSKKAKGVRKDFVSKGGRLTFKSLASVLPHKVNSVIAGSAGTSSGRAWNGLISVGSDCAGLLSEGTALELLQIPHVHKFASEQNQAVRHLLYDTYGKKSMRYYKDCTARNNDTVDAVDLYIFGFPCTPYSPAGLGAGMQDARSSPLLHCLEYIIKHRPKVVIAENSHRLASTRSCNSIPALLTTPCAYPPWPALLTTPCTSLLGAGLT